MERRQFLKYSSIFILMATGAVGANAGWRALGQRSIFNDILRERLGDIYDSEVSSQFLDELFDSPSNYVKKDFSLVQRLATSWYIDPFLPRVAIPSGAADLIVMFEERLVTCFLLSTNYFSDAKGGLEFRYLYDPYVSPCSNPFRGYS